METNKVIVQEERLCPCPLPSAYTSICLDLISLIEDIRAEKVFKVSPLIGLTLGMLIILAYVILNAKRTD